MQTQLLIDGIVRQVTVLIAQLATSGGARAPLAHVAGQVFVDLARELEAQGVSRKVSADMFGLALRSYQRKTQRLRESVTVRGRSLWEAVLEFLQREEVVSRARVLARFARDDQALLKGLLRDLTENGFVFASGTGNSVAYRAARPEELMKLKDVEDEGSLDTLIWSVIYREGPLSVPALVDQTGLAAEALGQALDRLLAQGRVEASPQDGGTAYRSAHLFIPLDAAAGWEAAVLDHVHALVRTICQKLGLAPGAREQEYVGGSTYSFSVYQGHPLEGEVLGTLKRFRDAQSALRAKVDAFNQMHGLPARYTKVVTYAGEHVIEESDDERETTA